MIEFWRSKLSDSSKKQYDVLLNAIREKKTNVELTKTKTSTDQILQIFQNLLYDHPELYYISPQLPLVLGAFSINCCLSYLYNAQQMQEIEKSFVNVKQALASERHKTDIEKVYSAVFLILNNSQYEINNIYNQNAASAIHYHAAQCSGFALAFKYVMDHLGIWCIAVPGNVSNGVQSGPHGWNILKLNDAYYHVDITSILASITLTDISQLSHSRLFESDAQKKQQGYVWDCSQTPICSEMNMQPFANLNNSINEARTKGRENADDDSFPVYTRLFDVQAKVKECLKNRISSYEFILNIPVYSNEKLQKMIMSYLSEQGKALLVAHKAEVGFVNGRFYLKINYNN